MAINKFVPLDIPIQDFCDEVGIEHDRYYRILTRWGKKAYGYMKDCGAAVTRKIEVFTFEDCKITLPKSVTAVELVVWGDHGCDCDAMLDYIVNSCDVMPQKVYGAPDTHGTVVERLNTEPYDFRIENDEMVFNKSFDGQKVTIRYWCFKTDCNGNILVNELAVDAIIAYYEFKLSNQTQWKNREFRLPLRTIEEKERRWRRKLAQARGDMIQNTMQEERNMAAIIKNSDFGGLSHYPHYAIGIY